MKKTLRAVGYIRVSTEDQVKGMSLISQEIDIEKYCKDRSIDLVRVFKDEGESAKTADRPDFREMLSFASDPKNDIDLVLVWKYDRFSRNQNDHHAIRASLRRVEVELISITQPLPEGSAGALLEGMMATISEYEVLVIGERTKRGSIEKRRSGRMTFKAPVGFMNKTYGEGKKAVKTVKQDPDRAHYIKQIFEMYAEDLHTQKEIVEHMNRIGFTMPRSGNPLTNQTLDRILKNEIYAGLIKISEEEGYTKAEFTPIISKALFEEVQILRNSKTKGRKKPHRKFNSEFPLKHFIRCPTCGNWITGSTTTSKGNKYHNYHLSKHKSGYECSNICVRNTIIEDQFVALLKRLRPSPGFKKKFKEAVTDVWQEKQGTTLEAIKAVEENIIQNRRRLNKLTNRWLDADSARHNAFFSEQRKRLEQEMLEGNSDLRHLQDQIVDLDALTSFALDMLEDASIMWLNADIEQRWKIQWTLFPEGLSYSPNEGFGNPVSSKAFNIFPLLYADESRVVPPTGFEPMLPAPEADALSN